MRIVYFTHSLQSCWNHGNAHFLRGVLRELGGKGHDVAAYEPAGAWSLQNLLADHGGEGLAAYRTAYPDLSSTAFDPAADLEPLVDGADLVIVHEWNDPTLVATLGKLRAHGNARFTLLFHDTHHRAVSDPDAIRAFDLDGYDGILAFGETLSQVYRRWGWRNVWTWHEAADVQHFRPPAVERERTGLVWIGNWGEGERTVELEEYLFRPAREATLPLDVHGVRYPPEALDLLARYGVRYKGWLPNARAPEVFAEHLATVHVPRRFYAETLPGIPTIRVFEALACGIPLVSAPWDDSENLFRAQDYLRAASGAEMTHQLHHLRGDPDLRADLVDSGLQTILSRHTCAHRADELLGIAATLRQPEPVS